MGLPGLSSLPEVDASLLRFDVLIWLVVPVAVLTWWLLFRTRWGLGLRAVGESPDTVFASGRDARLIRYQALWLGGMLAGVGGAHLSIAYAMNWSENMTAGRGFIAIALVIFAKWDPLRAVVGALLFSGAVALQLLLQSSGFQVSPFLLSTMPYVLTLVVLAVWGAPPDGRPGKPRTRLPGHRVDPRVGYSASIQTEPACATRPLPDPRTARPQAERRP